MAATNDNRVDTRFVGYFLVAFVLLLFGIYGLQSGELFGTGENDLPLDQIVLAQIGAIVGLILILLTIFSYRTGKSEATIVFPLVAIFLFIFYLDLKMNEEMGIIPHSGNWFLYVALAIFFLIIAIYVLIEKAPKFLALLLLFLGLVALFFGLACVYGGNGPCYNWDACKALLIVTGIFGFLGFIDAVYLGLAYADPKKFPLI